MSDLQPIMLIEDNHDDYEAATRSLKKNKCANPLLWCKSGQEGLDYLFGKGRYSDNENIRTPALILLDLNMPGMDGQQVLERIKNDPNRKSIPVVILTTSNDPKDVKQCYETGASTYIQKPVRFEGLCDAIRTITDYILPPNEA